MATLIGSPLGYPRFGTRGCVLDTYLRVAPDDEIVDRATTATADRPFASSIL